MRIEDADARHAATLANDMEIARMRWGHQQSSSSLPSSCDTREGEYLQRMWFYRASYKRFPLQRYSF